MHLQDLLPCFAGSGGAPQVSQVSSLFHGKSQCATHTCCKRIKVPLPASRNLTIRVNASSSKALAWLACVCSVRSLEDAQFVDVCVCRRMQNPKTERMGKFAAFKALQDKCKRCKLCPWCGAGNGLVKYVPILHPGTITASLEAVWCWPHHAIACAKMTASRSVTIILCISYLFFA